MRIVRCLVRLGALAALVATLSWRPGDAAAETGVWARQAMEDHGLGSCAELLEFAQRHVASGDAGAMVLLGLLSETGDCMPLDHGRAVELYRQAWDAGYDLAGARLGGLHLLGLGVPEDPARARELFRQAALRTTVHFDRFERLRTGVFRDTSVPPEMEAAIRWAKRLEARDAEAQLALARRFRADAGRPRNRDIAYHFARLAGRQGLAEAKYQYGRWLLVDATSYEDVESAVGIIEGAAFHCHLDAQIEMVWRYIFDLGVREHSASRAETYLRAAHRQGADMRAALWAFSAVFGGASPPEEVIRLRCD